MSNELILRILDCPGISDTEATQMYRINKLLDELRNKIVGVIDRRIPDETSNNYLR